MGKPPSCHYDVSLKAVVQPIKSRSLADLSGAESLLRRKKVKMKIAGMSPETKDDDDGDDDDDD